MAETIMSSSAEVLAASSDRLGPHGSVQVSTLIKSSSAADDHLVKKMKRSSGKKMKANLKTYTLEILVLIPKLMVFMNYLV